jgi:uroporphyrinogen III methyltransferase/synthase
MNHLGVVYLVGAGPGDPGLLTRRGAELLGLADVVVYDDLVNRELLRLAPATTERIHGGKHNRHCAISQAELNALLLAKARAGLRVVRLKGGDPCLFGRGGEEAEMLAAAGIPFEIVPGVSALQSVPGYAGIPVTHRQHSSQLTVVTGHESPDSAENRQDWPALARLTGTLVVLMGLKHLRAIAEALVAHGRPASTPVAVISQGTTPHQRTVVGTLASIAHLVESSAIKPPALTVIGPVVNLRPQLNWFEQQPFFGRRIVITQRADLAAPMITALRERGAQVWSIPATRWGPHPARSGLDRALAHLPDYDWILFSHPWAVDCFLDRFFQVNHDWRQLGTAQLGAYGPRTAARLKHWHLHPTAVAADHKTPLIMKALLDHGDVLGRRFLVLRGEEAAEHVPEALTELGAMADVVPVFAVEPDLTPSPEITDFLEQGADWLVFASGLAVRHFHQRFDLKRLLTQWPEMKLAAASRTIRWAFAELGLTPQVISQPDDVRAMVRDLQEAESTSRRAGDHPKSDQTRAQINSRLADGMVA